MSEFDRDDIHGRTKRFIDRWCEKLAIEQVDWRAASEPTKRCNCFGFGVGRELWWQPPVYIGGVRANPAHYWPPGASDDGSIDAYVWAAESEGFAKGVDGEWHVDMETIVLYFTERDGQFTHAARQRFPGVWERKLGSMSDIAHPT